MIPGLIISFKDLIAETKQTCLQSDVTVLEEHPPNVFCIYAKYGSIQWGRGVINILIFGR